MYLPFYLSILLAVSAIHVPLELRVDVCQAAVEDNEGDGLTAPTADRTAGIGAEFETIEFWLNSKTCDKESTDKAKRQVVAERTGLNFALTADTTETPGKLNAEYILDGQNIKVGTGDAARAGAAASADFIAWKPWDGPEANDIDVANSNCNPWSIKGVRQGTNPEIIQWDAQVTAPMPLEAMYFLMKDHSYNRVPPDRNFLDGTDTGGNNLVVVVTQEYFQSNPNGIDGNKVTDDVLGFCSLVLSYAKLAKKNLIPDQSPKVFLPFMPRTEFNTIFQQVKTKIPGDLFTLFNSLACYKADKPKDNRAGLGETILDNDYCSGPLTSPVSNNKFGELTFKTGDTTMNIKSWIQGIGSGTGNKDALSLFDEKIDGSIGGLGTATEKMFNSQRSVPLFEFRDLYELPTTSEFESFMAKADAAVQDLHKTYANAPQRKKRDIPESCYTDAATSSVTTSVPASITPAPTPSCELHNEDPDQGITHAFCVCDKSVTLSVLPATTAQSESCAYKSIPSATSARMTVTIPTQVWTSNCAACTLVGGIADAETCTSVTGCIPTAAPSPTIAAWVGNLSTIDIGNAEDGNGGKDLATEMFGKLKSMCSGSSCKGDHAEMDNVEAIIADGEEPLKPAMYFQDATFSNPAVLDKMLSVGISAWVSALNDPTLKLCKDVEYEADADETGSGCGKGPIPTSRLRRKTRRDDGAVLWERGGLAAEESRLAERCIDNCDRPLVCHYKARMCSAPNEITVVMAGAGSPYANHLNIGVTLDKDKSGVEGFLCEEITKALTAAVARLAPELLGLDVLEGFELEAICGIIDDPMSIIDNLQETVKVSRRAPKAVPA
ncbi:hypothetical protein K449DRAFT_421652 [Hypoxylon sp. EC38]|nr:hypothetical protein K449DRAFT_421652 [Hypoxylon sp. EC38]